MSNPIIPGCLNHLPFTPYLFPADGMSHPKKRTNPTTLDLSSQESMVNISTRDYRRRFFPFFLLPLDFPEKRPLDASAAIPLYGVEVLRNLPR